MKTFFSLLTFHLFVMVKCIALTWTGPIDISELNAEASLVVIDGSGDAISAWVHFDGANARIRSSHYAGRWNTPVNLSNAGFDASFHDIAMSHTGSFALAVWQLYNGTNSVIQAATYSAGSWRSPQTISTAGINAVEPKVSINSSGNGFAVWSESTMTVDVIKVASYSGGVWAAPQTLSNVSLQSMSPTVDMNDSGNTIAAWVSYDTVNHIFVVYGASHDLGIWTAELPLSTVGASSNFPKVVINSLGTGYAIWERGNDPLNKDAIAISHFDGTLWGPEEILSDPTFNASFPDIAINDSGSAAAVWRNSNESINVGAALFSAGRWKSPQTLSSFPNSKVHVGIDGNDNAIAVWSIESSGISEAQYAESFLGRWSSFNSIEDAFSPQIAINPSGEAVTVWNSFERADFLIQGAIAVP